MRHGKLMLTLVIVLAVCAFTGRGALAVVKDFAAYVPEDVQNLYSYPYSEQNVEKIGQSNTYKMFTSDEMKELMEGFIAMIPKGAVKDNPLGKAGLKLSDLLALKFGGFALACNLNVGQFGKAGPGNGAVSEALVIAAWLDGANPEIKTLVEKLTKALETCSEGEDASYKKSEMEIGGVKVSAYKSIEESNPVDGLLVFKSGDVTVLTSSKEFAAKIIGCIKAKGKGSLAQSELYKKTISRLDDRRMITSFGNVKEAIAEMQKAWNEQKIVEPKFLELLNLASVQAIAKGVWADEAGTFSHTYIYCPDGKFALLKLFKNNRKEFSTLKAVGRRAFMSFSVSLDPPDLYDYLLSLVKSADENAYEQALQMIKGMEGQFGVKLKEDLLASLGGEATLVVTSPSLQLDAQILPVPLALLLEIKDADKFCKTLKAVYEKFGMEPRATKYGEAAHVMEILPYMVICRDKKRCIIANSVRTMEEVLDTMDGAVVGLADTARFKAAQKALGTEASMFCYINLRDCMRAMVCMFQWAKLSGKLGSPTPDFDIPVPDTGEMPAPDEPAGAGSNESENPDAWPDEPAEHEVPEPVEPKMPGEGAMKNPMAIIKRMSALFRILGEYYPAVYMAVNGEKDGLHIRVAMP